MGKVEHLEFLEGYDNGGLKLWDEKCSEKKRELLGGKRRVGAAELKKWGRAMRYLQF